MFSLNKINCQGFFFSEELSSKRIKEFEKDINKKVIRNILCLSLYLLGVKRSFIALILLIPKDTVRSIIKSLKKDGLAALFDRRLKVIQTPICTQSKIQTNNIQNIEIDYKTLPSLQKKVYVLTLVDNKILTKNEAGNLLNMSTTHIRYLLKKISSNGIEFLIDKRQGQKSDYVFTPKIKSELISQFIINTSTNTRTSGKQIAHDLKERTSISVSERSVRLHLSKLGLINAKRIKEIILKKN